MRLSGVFAITAVVACCVGCNDYNKYQVSLRPDGKNITRTLTVERIGAVSEGNDPRRPVAAAELQRLAELYARHETEDDALTQRFSGEYADQLPADVGGYGLYAYRETTLGATALYSERFRGDDDIDARLAAQMSSADRLSRLLSGWLQSQMGADPNFEPVRRFLEGEFRQDLRNMSLLWWAARLQIPAGGRPEDVPPEAWLRLGQYLVEHGYVTIDELPTYARLFRGGSHAQQLQSAKHVLAGKVSPDNRDSVEASLSFLDDPEAVSESFQAYLVSTPEFQSLQERARLQGDDDPRPATVLLELVEPLVGFDPLYRYDTLELTLHLPVAPYATNGTFSTQTADGAGEVFWTDMLTEVHGLPTLHYAAWAIPHAEFQRQHFGRVIVSGAMLGRYVAWNLTLRDSERAEWDAFLAAMSPEQDIENMLREFEFSPEAAPGLEPAARQQLANDGRDVLLDGLFTVPAETPEPSR